MIPCVYRFTDNDIPGSGSGSLQDIKSTGNCHPIKDCFTLGYCLQLLNKRRLEVAFGEVYNLQPVQMNQFRSYNATSNKLFHSYAIFENKNRIVNNYLTKQQRNND